MKIGEHDPPGQIIVMDATLFWLKNEPKKIKVLRHYQMPEIDDPDYCWAQSDEKTFEDYRVAKEYAVSLLKKYKGARLSDRIIEERIDSHMWFNMPKLMCPYCHAEQEFGNYSADQIQELMKDPNRTYKCEKCGKLFDWKAKITIEYTSASSAKNAYRRHKEYQELDPKVYRRI